MRKNIKIWYPSMSERWHQCNPWTLIFDTEGSICGQCSSLNPDMVRWVTGVPRSTNPLTPKPKHKMRRIICFSEKIHWLNTVSPRVTVLPKNKDIFMDMMQLYHYWQTYCTCLIFVNFGATPQYSSLLKHEFVTKQPKMSKT